MLNEELVKYRLECLKMAYDTSFRIGNLRENVHKSEEDNLKIREALQDVLSLAEMNFDYIINGYEEDDDKEEVGY